MLKTVKDRVRIKKSCGSKNLGAVHVKNTSVNKTSFVLVLFAISLGQGSRAIAAPKQSHASGREAVAAVRHDWKKAVHATVRTSSLGVSQKVAVNLTKLSPEAILVYLHQQRNLNPGRFDAAHPYLGPLLAKDDRLRAAQSQGIQNLNGLLPDNARTRYLNYRRSLNPARFDHYHPTLGALLVENENLRKNIGVVAPELIPPQTIASVPGGAPASGPPVGGAPLGTRTVPEPAGMALIILGSTFILARKGFRYWKAAF